MLNFTNVQDLGNYPTLSPAIVEILSIVDRDDTSVEDVAALVAMDKVLYASLFKFVNSAAFGLRKQPNTVEEAINYLGLYGVKDLIFLLASRNFFSSPNDWEQSLFIAFVVKKLALRLGLNQKLASDIYMAGLVHDVGAMAFDKNLKKQHEEEINKEDLYLRLAAEKGVFGLHSLELSYQILEASEVPKAVLDIISTQSLVHDHESYTLANSLIDLANDLFYVDLADRRDLDEVIESEKFKKIDFDKLKLDLKFLRKMNSEIQYFVDY